MGPARWWIPSKQLLRKIWLNGCTLRIPSSARWRAGLLWISFSTRYPWAASICFSSRVDSLSSTPSSLCQWSTSWVALAGRRATGGVVNTSIGSCATLAKKTTSTCHIHCLRSSSLSSWSTRRRGWSRGLRSAARSSSKSYTGRNFYEVYL